MAYIYHNFIGQFDPSGPTMTQVIRTVPDGLTKQGEHKVKCTLIGLPPLGPPDALNTRYWDPFWNHLEESFEVHQSGPAGLKDAIIVWLERNIGGSWRSVDDFTSPDLLPVGTAVHTARVSM